jgi:predicted acylesterase/phospholipase RssA
MARRFDCVAMQGGGIRCFWQAGFLAAAGEALELRRTPIVAVSAAAGIGAAYAAGCLDDAVARFRAAADANPGNIHWGNLLSRKPLFPHASIYGRVLREVFDAAATERLRQGAGVAVLLARPPALPMPLVVGLSAWLYRAKKSMASVPWQRRAQALGFRAEYVDVRSCDSQRTVADLILASSCTPPFTPMLRWAGQRVIDGGLLESVPVSRVAGPPARALVLMTRAPRGAESFAGTHAVAWPSRPLSVSAWDYTCPQAIDDAVALGRQDAADFLERQARLAPA